MKDKKLVVKYTIICETDTSMVLGDTYEEKLENWVNDVGDALTSEIDHLGDVDYFLDIEEQKIEDYD